MINSLGVTSSNQTVTFANSTAKYVTFYNTSDADIYLRYAATPTQTVGEGFLISAGKTAVIQYAGQELNYIHFTAGTKRLEYSVNRSNTK